MLLARLAVVLVAAGAAISSARAGTWVVVPDGASATTTLQPNSSGVVMPGELSIKPAHPQQLTAEQLVPIWQAAGQAYGIPWQVLAAINKVESNFGQNMGPSSAGAVGWMQFMPSTWLSYGTDANGDGIADPWNAQDAIYSAARYLAASGGQTNIQQAVFAYNHADWYVREVLDLAKGYEAGGSTFPSTAQALSGSLQGAQQQVAEAKSALDEAVRQTESLASTQRALQLDATTAELLGDRLDATQQAAEVGVQLEQARAQVEELRTKLSTAEEALTSVRGNAAGASFAPGGGYMLGAPIVQNGFAFPVGGGPQLVSVSHTHHDYAAADIAAPAGTPVYAFAAAQVLRTWPDPQGNCGIGATMQTADGRVWTYCHLSYLEPTVVPGASLAAGDHVGLVGMTGHATGPHLHLQLQPPTSYPQSEAWFGSFAGVAFRWQDAPTPAAPAPGGPVFTVVAG